MDDLSIVHAPQMPSKMSLLPLCLKASLRTLL